MILLRKVIFYFSLLIVLVGIVALGSFKLKDVYAQGNRCMPKRSCVNNGEQCIDEKYCGGCLTGLCCCGSENWQQVLNVKKQDLHLLGISMTSDSLISLIQMFVLIGISGLALALVAVFAYGGILWSSGGDKEEKIQKSQKVFKGGGIAILITFGFIVLLLVFAGMMGLDIWDFSFLDDILG